MVQTNGFDLILSQEVLDFVDFVIVLHDPHVLKLTLLVPPFVIGQLLAVES